MAGIMDTFKGLVDGEQRLKNLSEYDEYVDRMLSQGAATLTGQTPGEYYKNPKTIRQFNRQKSMREKPALADRLSKNKFDTGLKSFINPIRETLLLPAFAGGLDAYDKVDRATRPKNLIKDDIDPKDIEQLAAIIGKDPTTQDIEEFIYQNSPASNFGYGLGIAAETPAFAALGIGKVFKGALNLFKSKSKTTGNVGADVVGVDGDDFSKS